LMVAEHLTSLLGLAISLGRYRTKIFGGQDVSISALARYKFVRNYCTSSFIPS